METKSTRQRRSDIRLSTVTQADTAACARIFFLAFEADKNMPAFMPNCVGLTTAELLSRNVPPEEKRLLRSLVAKDTCVMKATVRVADSTGTEKEKIVGWAKWEAPQGFRRRSFWEWLWSEIFYPLHQLLFRPDISAGLPEEAHALIESQYSDAFGPGGIAEGKKSWHLHLLAVEPAWWGVGIGSTLLEWGMEKAKETDSVVYLSSSKAGRPVYLAKGFRIVSHRTGKVNGLPVSLPGMLWMPGWSP